VHARIAGLSLAVIITSSIAFADPARPAEKHLLRPPPIVIRLVRLGEHIVWPPRYVLGRPLADLAHRLALPAPMRPAKKFEVIQSQLAADFISLLVEDKLAARRR
jgi:hypothetical protein